MEQFRLLYCECSYPICQFKKLLQDVLLNGRGSIANTPFNVYFYCICLFLSINNKQLENRICMQIQDLHASFWCKRAKEPHRKFDSHFQDTAWLSKLAYWCIFLKDLQKLHMDTFYPNGVEIELAFAPRAVVSEIQADFYIWAWNLEFEKVPEVAYGPSFSFYPKGLKLSLFSLYEQLFPRYEPIFKIATLGHETWNLKKVPEVA